MKYGNIFFQKNQAVEIMVLERISIRSYILATVGKVERPFLGKIYRAFPAFITKRTAHNTTS